MLWAAGIGRAAYDPETISMLTTVLERALAALPRQDRTEERKTRLASSILGAAARGERDPLLLYATALGGGPWEPAIGEGPASQPIRSIYGQAPRVAWPVEIPRRLANSRECSRHIFANWTSPYRAGLAGWRGRIRTTESTGLRSV